MKGVVRYQVRSWKLVRLCKDKKTNLRELFICFCFVFFNVHGDTSVSTLLIKRKLLRRGRGGWGYCSFNLIDPLH